MLQVWMLASLLVGLPTGSTMYGWDSLSDFCVLFVLGCFIWIWSAILLKRICAMICLVRLDGEAVNEQSIVYEQTIKC